MKPRTALIALGLLYSSAARADGRDSANPRTDDWVVAEVPAALTVEGPASTRALPAIGVYRDNGLGALGLRMRAGAVSGADSDSALSRVFAAPGLAVRLGLDRLWYEQVFGIALAGGEPAVSFELAAGLQFQIGSVSMGASLRYLLIDSATAFDAGILLLGAELGFGKRSKSARDHATFVASSSPHVAPQAIAQAPCTSDGRNCDQHLDGAIKAGRLHLRATGVVIEEGLLFGGAGEQLLPAGEGLLATLASRWNEHPSWQHLWIETCTNPSIDPSGDQGLDLRRIEQIRNVLIARGVDRWRIAASGPVEMPPDQLSATIDARAAGITCRYCLEFAIQSDERSPQVSDAR